jgi:pimeloyl-ACP methyl ester carboxylesterase
MTYSERVISVGVPPSLAGIFTSPEQATADSPALVLLNSGMMHHVGTCNLSVKFARSAASNGVPAYRFDFSGIGDSRTRNFAGTHEQREVSEVREVLDALTQQEGVSKFVLCGLCSGADAALAAAAIDSRVVGIIQLDPLCRRVRNWYFHHYYQKVMDVQAWRRVFRRLRGLKTGSEGISPEYLEEVDEQARHDLDHTELTRAYAELASRGVRVMVIMTEGQYSCYNSQGQFRDAFASVDFGSGLEEYHLPNTRHIITEPDDQDFVIDLVTNWSIFSDDR